MTTQDATPHAQPLGNVVGWFEIYVQDLARARVFYEAVFERTLEVLEDPTGEIDMLSFGGNYEGYGAQGALVKMKGVESGHNSTLVYFSCEDCAVQQARVAAHGGKVIRPKFAIGEYGFVAMVADTEGNMIGLHSMQ